jgi:hypothetical protein
MKDDPKLPVPHSLAPSADGNIKEASGSSDFFDHDRDDIRPCPYCRNSGYISVDGGSLNYPCQDCNA